MKPHSLSHILGCGVGCVENVEIWLFDMPYSHFYGKWHGKHVCEVPKPSTTDRGNLTLWFTKAPYN